MAKKNQPKGSSKVVVTKTKQPVSRLCVDCIHDCKQHLKVIACAKREKSNQ